MIPGRDYVIAVGAGGLGGQGARRAIDHGEGGTEGGFGLITDGDTFVWVVDGVAPSGIEHRAADRMRTATNTNSQLTPTTDDRFAIVDIESNVVDNVIVASDQFFALPLVKEALLVQRVVRRGEAHILVPRLQPALAVRLAPNEPAAPRWVVRPGVNLMIDSNGTHRFEPGDSTTAEHIPTGGWGGSGGISRVVEVDISRPSLRILTVATEWLSHHGGISTLNRELCVALAAADHVVVCLLPGPLDANDREDARQRRVILVEAPKTLGKGTPKTAALHRPVTLPAGFTPDAIIGHGHVTGPAAMSQVQDSFKFARRVHVLHTQPGEIEWYKVNDGDPLERAQNSEAGEEYLIRGAALTVGIGPRLHGELRRLIHPLSIHPPSLELVPGLGGDDEERALPPTRDCLFLGRTEDPHLKGLDIAAHAVARARKKGQEVGLAIRGASPANAARLRDELSSILDAPNVVRVRAFDASPDVIRNEIISASLVLMPSRSDGFGLVTWEAIGLAVPVLVSDQTGVGQLLKREIPQLAEDIVVPMAMNDAATFDVWGDRVTKVMQDRHAAFERAAELRAALRPKFTWAATVRDLIAAIRRT